MSLKVLIVEGQEVLRIGLRSIFTTDPKVSKVYEATNERGLQSHLLRYEFDLIVVNQELLTDFSILRKKTFVILTAEPNMSQLKDAYEYGARGYLSINVPFELLSAILRPNENAFLIEPTLVPLVMECIFDRGRYTSVNEVLLTPREREIVYLLREGRDRPSIARQLCIAETTLKTHIKNIAKKHTTEVSLEGKHI